MERGMPMAVCRMGKGLQKGRELSHRMSRKYAKGRTMACVKVRNI